MASAAKKIAELNPHVKVETHAMRLDAANALDLIAQYDLVADGSDNFATRYLVSDACFLAGKPLVTRRSACSTGRSPPSAPTRRMQRARRIPTYRCLFPEPPRRFHSDLFGSGHSWLADRVNGILMALEVIREIVGFGEASSGGC